MDEYEKSLAECRLKIAQTEAKMNALQETAKDVESRKRALEEQVDALNHEVKSKRMAYGVWRMITCPIT